MCIRDSSQYFGNLFLCQLLFKSVCLDFTSNIMLQAMTPPLHFYYRITTACSLPNGFDIAENTCQNALDVYKRQLNTFLFLKNSAVINIILPTTQFVTPNPAINLHKKHPVVALKRNAGVLSVFVTEQ